MPGTLPGARHAQRKRGKRLYHVRAYSIVEMQTRELIKIRSVKKNPLCCSGTQSTERTLRLPFKRSDGGEFPRKVMRNPKKKGLKLWVSCFQVSPHGIRWDSRSARATEQSIIQTKPGQAMASNGAIQIFNLRLFSVMMASLKFLRCILRVI